MEKYDFPVIVQANNREEAKEVLKAMFDIMITIRKKTSTRDFIDFAAILVKDPSLVETAKMVIDANKPGK